MYVPVVIGLIIIASFTVVLSVLLVKFIVDKLNIDTIIQSNFSLKEGVVFEILNQKLLTK